MTPKQLDKRIIQSRRALAGWKRENTPISRAQIDTELGVLEGLLAVAPVGKQAKIRALIEKYSGK